MAILHLEEKMVFNGEEIFFVDRNEKESFVYLPLRSYLGITNKENKSKFFDLNNPQTASFYSKIKERKYIDIHKIHEIVQKGSSTLSIAVTDDCNIGCLYCHHSAGEFGRFKSIDFNIAKIAIDKFFLENEKEKSLRIIFMGGGETTTNMPLLKKIISYTEEKAHDEDKKVFFRMATNGIFSKEIAEYICEHFEEISLSFDGPAHIQNFQRPTKSGEPSFDYVFATAKFFYEKKFPFAFRATVSDYSMPYLEEMVDFFAENFPGKQLGLEPLNPFGRANRQNKLNSPSRKDFYKRLIEIFEYSKGKNIKILSAGVGKFENLRTIFCGAVGKPSYTILTDGTVSCCTRDNVPEQFNFGKYNPKTKEFDIDHTKIANIRKMNVYCYPECQDCFCKYHCAGDCPDLRLSGLVDCDANRMVGKYFLEQKYIIGGKK